ncbi:MAG: hypothetical protein OXN84_19980 [Albidovulum sp.]|nr:hypothetical protein [Albidovulum sp.]
MPLSRGKQRLSFCSGAVDQPVLPLRVPGPADQVPLALNGFDATQTESPESKNGPDDPELRLNRRLKLNFSAPC